MWAAPTSETLEKLLGKEAAARFKAVPDRFAELAICVRSSFPWLEKLAQLDTSVLFDLHGVLVGQPPELLTMLQVDEVSLLCDFEETRHLLSTVHQNILKIVRKYVESQTHASLLAAARRVSRLGDASEETREYILTLQIF